MRGPLDLILQNRIHSYHLGVSRKVNTFTWALHDNIISFQWEFGLNLYTKAHDFYELTCRPDHNLQDVRAKIFPFKTRKVKAPEIVPSISLPVRRKERSLSSLVVNTPRVSSHTGLTGRRTKAVARRALRGPSFPLEDSIKKEEDTTEDYPESSSSRETLNKIVQNRRQVKKIWQQLVYYPFGFQAQSSMAILLLLWWDVPGHGFRSTRFIGATWPYFLTKTWPKSEPWLVGLFMGRVGLTKA